MYFSPFSTPMRLDATNGTMFAAAWPCMVRCQCALESKLASCGSEPMAVGYSNISAPISAMQRAASGNH